MPLPKRPLCVLTMDHTEMIITFIVALVAVVALYLSLTQADTVGATFIPMQLCDEALLPYPSESYGRYGCVPSYAVPSEQEYSQYSSRNSPYESI